MTLLPVLFIYLIFAAEYAFSSPHQGGIPSKAEISNLMESVNQIFDGVKKTFIEELDATDESVPIEIEKLADRAKENLDLIEEMSLLKLTSLSGSEITQCTRDFKVKIQKIVTEGDKLLDKCISQAGEATRKSSSRFVEETNVSVMRGHSIIDSVDQCVQKNGLHQLSCFRKILNNDVDPLRDILLNNIRKHKDHHMSTLQIRSVAYNCVGNILTTYKKKVAEVLMQALAC